jgi:peptidoglycan-N-acetylglucosamine deacetylase
VGVFRFKNIKNILTVDVEDWYMDTDISYWTKFEDRIVNSTDKILDILKDTKATFFILGYVAKHHPELIRRIHDSGHEIGTHGYSHKPITLQTQSQFKEELLKSMEIIKSITGEDVYCHRASNFTIMKNTAWAIDIMKTCGIKYDSSVFPVKTPLYGIPDAPLFPYSISTKHICGGSDEGIYELPLSVLHLPFKNIPIAGGFYLRFFPYWLIKNSIEIINKEGKSAVIYLHPWEIDVKQPKIKELKWYHYHNLYKTESKFRKLLKDFEFTSIRKWLHD